MRATIFFVCFLFLTIAASAQMTTRVVRDSLFIPWELVYGPDDHIWFTQKNGYICRLEPVSGKIDTLYHETNTVVNNEGGMLGMALHPSFATAPYVYVAYQYNQSGYKERIVRYTYANNALSNPQILLDNITGAGIHNGCRLIIVGDKLFITTGDAANQSTPQNIQSLNGKTLRINLDGSIPSDNPFPNNPVWSWGHRNAQGMVYVNGKLYQSEHGPSTDDEINLVMKGRNYGWPNVAGRCNTPPEITFCNDSNVVEPIISWTPTIAVSGMDYYNHPMFPGLQNSLLMTTLKDEELYFLKLNATQDSFKGTGTISGVNFGRLRDICISPTGKIYISTSKSSASGTGNKVDQIIEIYDPSFVNNVQDVSNSETLTIYPNPSGDFTIIKLPTGLKEEPFEYAITDASGREVLKNRARGNNVNISTRHLSTGIYQIRIYMGDGKTFRGKMVKQ
ncbi:MAG TPA: PQQ-dependent sugar dehydrogenase [Flavipsychrobacter sp.]|nr:PQQ-dependent sugar dehydrogenase [Flavipsychrobacter sp.]